MNSKYISSALVAIYLLFATTSHAFAVDSDVLRISNKAQSMKLMAADIAKYFGVRPNTTLHLNVVHVSKSLVNYQAKLLLEKTNQLLSDVADGKNTSNKNIIIMSTSSLTIEKAVNEAAANLQKVLKQYNITPTEVSYSHGKANLTSVYVNLKVVTKIIDQLLENPTRPSDVYQNITLASYYASKILKAMPGASVATNEDTFIPNKEPKDVFKQLYTILDKLNTVLDNANITVLSFTPVYSEYNNIDPRDVYDISMLIIAELKYIASAKGIDLSDIKSYHPGKKFPADVFKRSSLLLKQISKIQNYINAHPEWLSVTGEHTKAASTQKSDQQS